MHNPDHASGADLDAMASSNDGPSDAELVALGHDGGLLSTIFGGALVDDEDPFLDRLVALHNSGQIDLLALPLEELTQLDTHDYFDGHSRLYRIIPRLQGETLPMMRLVNALVARAGEDLASNMPNAAYRDWAEVDPVRPKEGVALAMQGDADAIRVLRFNLEAGGFVDLALELTTSSDPERRLPAIVALGKIAVGDNQERSALKAFKTSLDAFPDDATAANILSTTLELGRRSSALNDPAVLDVLDAALSLAGPMTHYVAASKLSDAPMPEAVVSRLLDVLADTDRSHHRTIQFLDTGLASLLGGPHEELAETMMRRLLTDPERALQVSALRSSGRRLLDRPADRLSKTISRWLLSDEHRLRQALDKFLSAADRKEAMDFTVTGENLMPLDQLLLCRRACGYFFVKPMLAASILVGVLRDGAPEVRRQVAELLYDPLVINYGGMARDYLAAIDPRDPAHPFVATVLTRLEARNAALEAAGFLDELAPSASRRQMEATRSASVMREAYKEAERHSVFLNLVTRQTLLHGRGSLSYFRGPSDKVDRSTVTQMHGQSYTYELPREEVLDPVGLGLKIMTLMHGVLRP